MMILQEERRADPEDKQWRTLADIRSKLSGKSEAECQAYWENCIPMPPMEFLPPAPPPLLGPPGKYADPICLRETLAFDPEFAEALDKRLNEPRVPQKEAISALCQHAGMADKLPELDAVVETQRQTWRRTGLLSRKGLMQYEPQMLALYINSLEEFPVYSAWRVLTQWSDDRSKCMNSEPFLAAVRWMTWLDQSLALLPQINATTAYRVVKDFRYGDFLTRFRPGRQDLMWYEPKSVAWNSPGCTDGEKVAREWAGKSPGQSTIFIIENFTGHDVSFLSAYAQEHEAMNRALTPFEVVHAQLGDASSDDVLTKCDRVHLKQLPVQRREPITCRELNQQEVKKYARYVKDMELVELFKHHFDIEWDEESGISEENMRNAMKHDEKLQGFGFRGGTQAMKIKKSTRVHGDSGISHEHTLLAYNKGVAGRYDTLYCRAVQSANFDEDAFTNACQRKARECRGDVRQRLGAGHWFWYLFMRKQRFDEYYGLDAECDEQARLEVDTQRVNEQQRSFTDVLCGCILATAIQEKRLIYHEDRSGEFRLLGKPSED